MVPLQLGLSIVRRFDLSSQAEYFFIPFKRTSNPPPPPHTHTKRGGGGGGNGGGGVGEREKKENDHVQMIQNFTRAQHSSGAV